MVARLGRILRRGGEFRFVTDIADYAAWTLQRLATIGTISNGRRNAPTIGASHGPILRGTRYHSQGGARRSRVMLSELPSGLTRFAKRRFGV